MDIKVICINTYMYKYMSTWKTNYIDAVVLMGPFFKISRVIVQVRSFSLAKFYECDSSKEKKSLHNR